MTGYNVLAGARGRTKTIVFHPFMCVLLLVKTGRRLLANRRLKLSMREPAPG